MRKPAEWIVVIVVRLSVVLVAIIGNHLSFSDEIIRTSLKDVCVSLQLAPIVV